MEECQVYFKPPFNLLTYGASCWHHLNPFCGGCWDVTKPDDENLAFFTDCCMSVLQFLERLGMLSMAVIGVTFSRNIYIDLGVLNKSIWTFSNQLQNQAFFTQDRANTVKYITWHHILWDGVRLLSQSISIESRVYGLKHTSCMNNMSKSMEAWLSRAWCFQLCDSINNAFWLIRSLLLFISILMTCWWQPYHSSIPFCV